MVSKPYDFAGGAILLPHTARKLKILSDYLDQYLRVRCVLPQQSRFKLAIVDGFAGGGRYSDGEAGSPIVFLETLQKVVSELTLKRKIDGMASLSVQCRLILNDSDPDAVQELKKNIAPVLASIKDLTPELTINPSVTCKRFEEAFPQIKQELLDGGYGNVLFNLDQCGHSLVSRTTIDEILATFRSSEVFLTFMIESLLSFLRKNDPAGLLGQLRHFGLKDTDAEQIEPLLSKTEWLGTAERIVYNAFKGAAAFVSPFSVHNPEGWRYWLMHFSSATRARQVYNDVLHRNATHQAHFGRSGLNMLSYDPDREGGLYLFDDDGRKKALEQLMTDVPRVVSGFGDAIGVEAFYRDIYSLTAAHSEDIRAALYNADDLEIITPNGGERRKSGTISNDDTIRLKTQRSFHFQWK